MSWLKDNGFTAALVGGYCRKLKYGKDTDIDIAVLVETIDEIEVLQNEFGVLYISVVCWRKLKIFV
ncbi:tRNA nucleotidyltransferase [Acinetobacter phage TCUAN2]|nr:tRNA nucleotidyltransferase [Acinetobacter phage TCUAN2]